MDKITFDGKQYPCRMTMGALRRYKQIEGEDISKMNGDVAKVGTLLYCCIASASSADGVMFDVDIDDFADRVTVQQVGEFAKVLNDTGKAKKKTGKP